MSNSLLNLLNINRSHSSGSAPQHTPVATVSQRASSVLTHNGGQPTTHASGAPGPAPDFVPVQQTFDTPPAYPARLSAARTESAASSGPPPNTQKYLLDLLTTSTKPSSQPKKDAATGPPEVPQPSDLPKEFDSSAKDATESFDTKPAEQQFKREVTPVRQFGSPSPSAVKFEAPQPSKAGIFNYVNPFLQLQSSSPLNASPNTAERKLEVLKHDRSISGALNGDDPAPAVKSRRLMSPPDKAVKQETELGVVSEPKDDPVPSTQGPLSVSERLENVGESVDKEVERALANAEMNADQHGKAEPIEGDDVASHWSTAEDEDAKIEEETKVEVYNFPMKPFVTLLLQSKYVPRSFKASTWEGATPVARLKKDFSHDDRTLATASQSYILYAVVPTEKKPAPGLKIIRQDDGKNKHIWSKADERLCNVQVSSTGHDDAETVLATGIHGTIFYTTLSRSRGDEFADDDIEGLGFVMSPPPNSDEPSSSSAFGTSSAIKTRAKLSSRHATEFFAVARGRQIHLIVPSVVMDDAYTHPTTRRVNTDKYLSEHSLSINTGKAGKDFCFSEDDTVLVSLDKVGKVKFWDIRLLTSAIEPVRRGSVTKSELKDPIHTFTAGVAPAKSDDKMSPSSIMFVDKDRACAKGVALRYVLIGYLQNHVLQLWDLGLGKCVQELRFPESVAGVGKSEPSSQKENSHAVCSVTYHPKTSIICVGHPGRNSVYFIHLSAPKYNLPQMDQATYISLLARGDSKSLPRPESTAIMSGIREFSCDRVGELRSLDVLKTPFPSQAMNGSSHESDDEVVFELYLMHAKGVLGLPITRADLGWDTKGKQVKPADAVEKGVVVIDDLIAPPIIEEKPIRERESDVVSKSSSKMSKRDKERKEDQKAETKRDIPTIAPANSTSTPSNGISAEASAKENAKPNKQTPEARSTQVNPQFIPSESYAVAASKAGASEDQEQNHAEPSAARDIPSKEPVTREYAELLSSEIASLYSKLDSDKRVADAAGAARQDAMLRLVSSTLTENVEGSLQRIVSTGIEQKVLPALMNETMGIAEKSMSQGLKKIVPDAVAKELKATLPDAIKTGVKEALSDHSVLRLISHEVAGEVTKKLSGEVASASQRSFGALQSSLVSQIAQHNQEVKTLVADAEARAAARIQEFETRSAAAQRETLGLMQESENRMAQFLVALREEQGRLAAGVASLQGGDFRSRQAEQPLALAQREEPSEVARLTQMLDQGNFEQATIEVSPVASSTLPR